MTLTAGIGCHLREQNQFKLWSVMDQIVSGTVQCIQISRNVYIQKASGGRRFKNRKVLTGSLAQLIECSLCMHAALSLIQYSRNHGQWNVPAIPAFSRWRQEGQKRKVIFCCTIQSSLHKKTYNGNQIHKGVVGQILELNLKYELELGKIQRCREGVSKEVRIFSVYKMQTLRGIKGLQIVQTT